jgi:ketosteroid isomerase-like protein
MAVEKEKQPAPIAKDSTPENPTPELIPNPEVDEFFKKLKYDLRWPKPSPEAITAALHAMQRLGVEVDAEEVTNRAVIPGSQTAGSMACPACGSSNRDGNKFCGICGAPLMAEAPQGKPGFANSSQANGQHHYHHHYHHHFFPASSESLPETVATGRVATAERPAKDLPARASLGGPAVSRAEATVRKLTQDWALACNTKQLDDLVDLYAPDALVLRSNFAPVRGVAAIREFFFAALDAGLGDVEMEPMRVEVFGEIAYEGGRCKMLVPFAVGKRREERGKYLMVFAKQKSGDWKAVADCWSSDLTLNVASEAETGKTTSVPARPGVPRKGT